MIGWRWIKKGKIFDPTGRFDWMQEYTQNPNAIIIEDKIRVYFTCRPKCDLNGMYVSYIGFIELRKGNLSEVTYIHNRPVMGLGGRGDFDEFGTMPGSLVNVEGEIWLYYVGWSRPDTVPYKWAIGLAISKDGGYTFEKFGKILALEDEKVLFACPRVWRQSSDEWIMWYQKGSWIEHKGEKVPVYVTMQARSDDGVNWRTDDNQIMPSVVENECHTSASVIEYKGYYHMFFSYRYGTDFRKPGRGYRIGYAWSEDLKTWHRDDSKAGIDISSEGWDSEMVCYPHVVRVDDKIFMFYCGNDFGRYGFGYAILEE